MSNSDYSEEELVKSMRRLLNSERLEKYVQEPLQAIITPLLNEKEIDFSDIIHTVLLTIFTYIDLFGYLYKGENSSTNAVDFIRDYLGKVNQRYEEIGGLLYHTIRHGLVHIATTKRIELKNEKILDFSFGVGHEGHLSITKTPEMQSTGTIDIHLVFIDLSRLYEDFVSAIGLYSEDIKRDQNLSEIFNQSFITRRNPKKEKEISIRKQPYILDSDFDTIQELITKLEANISS